MMLNINLFDLISQNYSFHKNSIFLILNQCKLSYYYKKENFIPIKNDFIQTENNFDVSRSRLSLQT